MTENEKGKASVLSSLASTFAFIYVLCESLSLAVSLIGLFREVTLVVGILCSFILPAIVPAAGLAGVVLGIVALCRLTPEERRESAWGSTSKGNALVGVILPPTVFVLRLVLSIVIFAQTAKR